VGGDGQQADYQQNYFLHFSALALHYTGLQPMVGHSHTPDEQGGLLQHQIKLPSLSTPFECR
jgi:hypothetical protein